MAPMTLTGTRIRAGIWEGVLMGSSDLPPLEVVHLGVAVNGLRLSAVPGKTGEWAVQLPIPA